MGLLASGSLFVQWRTGNPWMFVVRSLLSLVRCGLMLQLSLCGRAWLWQPCDWAGWHDVRLPFRIINCFASLRFLVNALSLLLQFLFPKRGVTALHGNEQLLY